MTQAIGIALTTPIYEFATHRHPTTIRKAETRRQKHDRRDAARLLRLLAEGRFPAIWMPSTEYRDLRSLLLHRHQWVRMRTRVQNALHAIAMAHGVRRGHTLWNREGQALLASLPLPPHTAHRRSELQALYQHLDAHVDRLGERVKQVAEERPRATLLMTHPGVGSVTALATEVFVGDPARFLDGKALASYVGMIPSEYSSGKRQRLGALTKQGNPFLRFLWCEAAAHAVRRDPDLQRFYRRKVAQKGFAKANVGGDEAGDSALDHVARSDRLRGILPSWPGAAVVSAVCAGMPVLALVLE